MGDVIKLPVIRVEYWGNNMPTDLARETKREPATLYEARLRVSRTKQAMDYAQAALEKAENEWHEACVELDRLEGMEPPSFREMRGILKPDSADGERAPTKED